VRSGATSSQPEERPHGRRRRYWPLAGLLAGGLLVFAGAVAWSYRVDLATTAVQRAIDRQGLSPARFVIDRVDFHGLQVRDVSLRGGALRATELTVAYSLAGLVGGRLGGIEITGLRLALTDRGDGLLFGGVPLGGSSSSSSFGGGPMDAIKLTDAQLLLESAGSRYQATLSGEAALDGRRIRATSIVADIAVQRGADRHVLRIVAPALDVALDGDALAARFTKTSVTAADPPWAAEAIDGEIHWHAGQARAKILSGTVSSTQAPPLIRPASLRASATLEEQRADYTAQLAIEAPGGKGRLVLDAKGRHDVASGTGSADIVMAPVVFRPDGLQPADFFPRLGAAIGRIGGSLALAGPVRWQGGKIASDIVVRLVDGSLDAAKGKITALHGDVRVAGLLPPATPPGQELAGLVEIGGLPSGKAAIGFQLRPDSTLAVEKTSFELARGRIGTSPFVVDPAVLKVETALRVDEVDLSEIFQLIGVDGLSGTGRLSGGIPLTLDGTRYAIRGGSLAADGPGVLRFKSDSLPPGIASAGEEMALALRALEDFRYDSLSLTLDKGETGEGTIGLHLSGANPAVFAGRTFNFNIKFESNFDRLTDLALRSLTATQDLLRRAERSMTK
jgi:hypothetical protein